MSSEASSSQSKQKKKKKKINQHLPCPPDDKLSGYIRYYWSLGYSDGRIAKECMDHFKGEDYGLRRAHKYSVKRRREKMGLESALKRKATHDEILPLYNELRAKFPNMGTRGMVNTLRLEYGMKVSELRLSQFLKVVDAGGVARRKRKRFRRKRFWAAGVMDILCFSMISGNGIPLVTQSDLGSENNGIANCHTVTRQRLDPSLEGTLQHRWMSKKALNVKPEATWSQMRRQFTPGFENVLDEGVNRGLFQLDRPLEKLVFRWLAIPWLQHELDLWVKRYNATSRRHDNSKVLPHGIPDMIASKPEKYSCADYKVNVTPELFDEMEQDWAPPSDPVFKLVPDVFHEQASAHYESLDQPLVNVHTFWVVYSALLSASENAIQISDPATSTRLHAEMQAADDHFEYNVDLMADQQELRNGGKVIGDINGENYEYLGGLPAELQPAFEESDDDDEGDGGVVLFDVPEEECVDFTDDEAKYE